MFTQKYKYIGYMFPFTVAELRNCPSPPLENGPWARGDIFRPFLIWST